MVSEHPHAVIAAPDGRIAVLEVKRLPIVRRWYVVRRADHRLLSPAAALRRFLVEEGAAHLPEMRLPPAPPLHNLPAQEMLAKVFETCDRPWRGIGVRAEVGAAELGEHGDDEECGPAANRSTTTGAYAASSSRCAPSKPKLPRSTSPRQAPRFTCKLRQ